MTHSKTWFYYLKFIGKTYQNVSVEEKEYYHANYHALYRMAKKDLTSHPYQTWLYYLQRIGKKYNETNDEERDFYRKNYSKLYNEMKNRKEIFS